MYGDMVSGKRTPCALLIILNLISLVNNFYGKKERIQTEIYCVKITFFMEQLFMVYYYLLYRVTEKGLRYIKIK